MATPRTKVVNSNKKVASTAPAKKPKTPRSKQVKKKIQAPPKSSVVGAGGSGSGADPVCLCCEACSGLTTGTWGIVWYNAAGEWACLPGPTAAGSNKVLGADEHGPYWKNP